MESTIFITFQLFDVQQQVDMQLFVPPKDLIFRGSYSEFHLLVSFGPDSKIAGASTTPVHAFALLFVFELCKDYHF